MIALPAAPLILLAVMPCQAGDDGPTSGAYRILIDGKPAGVERFESTASGAGRRLRVSGETGGDGEARKIESVAEYRDGRLTRYEVTVTGAAGERSYAADFTPGGAEVSIAADGRRTDRTLDLTEGAILLDRDVWHHYQLLLDRYDRARRGKQQFQVFVPQANFKELAATVNLRGQSSFGEAKQRANRFTINLGGGFEVTALTDEAGRLLSLEVPSEKIRVLVE